MNNDILDSAFELPHNVVSREFAHETVMLNLDTGKYHGINPTAARMLEVLQQSASGHAAAATLAETFGPSVERIAARVPTTADWWWTKLLFAQVLPLAASLQGVECLHASCVALDGRAYALSAPSGTGKSSVALHLATRGGRFVCDDILATDVGGRGVAVHSGPSFTAADPAELARVPAATRPRALAARDDPKTYIELATACGPLPLERMYFLRRDHDAAALEIRPLDDAPPVLASPFLSYLT